MNKYFYKADGSYLIETFDGQFIEPFNNSSNGIEHFATKSEKKSSKKGGKKPSSKSEKKMSKKGGKKPTLKSEKKMSKKSGKKSSIKSEKKSSKKPSKKSSKKPSIKSEKKMASQKCRVVDGGCDRTNNHTGYIWGGWDEVGAPAGKGVRDIDMLEKIGGCDGCKSGCNDNEYISQLGINKCKNGGSYQMSFKCCEAGH